MQVNYPGYETVAAGHGHNTFAMAATDPQWSAEQRAALAAIAAGKGESISFGSGRRYTAPNGVEFLGHDTADGYRLTLVE